jgi:hypothetical protein
LERKTMTLIAREQLIPHVGNITALVGLGVLAYRLIELEVWAAVVGAIVDRWENRFPGRGDAHLHRTQRQRPGLGRAAVLT